MISVTAMFLCVKFAILINKIIKMGNIGINWLKRISFRSEVGSYAALMP